MIEKHGCDIIDIKKIGTSRFCHANYYTSWIFILLSYDRLEPRSSEGGGSVVGNLNKWRNCKIAWLL